MKIENIEVYGFRRALHGARNPMNSWHRSDSTFERKWVYHCPFDDNSESHWGITTLEGPVIGPKDLELVCKLIKGGAEHRKFLRQIQIWMDITIPRYVWTELDTYKVATVRNSCSTMFKLGSKDLTQEDFQYPINELLLGYMNTIGEEFRLAKKAKDTKLINKLRIDYKNILPEGFLQKSTYSMNYETALTMYFQRKNHRLPEWNIKNPESICSMIISLPYMKEFIGAKEK